jgi:hypothetical protein
MNSQEVVVGSLFGLRLRLVKRFTCSYYFLCLLIPNDPLAFVSFEYWTGICSYITVLT